MTCGIDEICKDAKRTLDRFQQELVEELLADFDQEADVDAILQSKEVRDLRGQLELFTVWLVHNRLKEESD